MKTLYFDCVSGASGDMMIGALLDLGADPKVLQSELKKLQIEDEYTLTWKKVIKNGITSTKFDVELVEQDDHEHDHGHDHGHDHSHDHDHGHHHRSYVDIKQMIKQAGFSEGVERMALAIFRIIGEAEGKIHGLPLDEVHFHEVGAVDSIIDIVGTAILIDQLQIDSFVSSPVPVGSGKIHIDHGIYPVPAPATLEIMRGVPIAQTDVKAELTTPTGAAIIAVLAESFGPIPSMTVGSIGYGAGTKDFPKHPNVLRVIISEEG